MSTRTLTDMDVRILTDAIFARVQPDPLPQLLSVSELAGRLGVSEQYVRDHREDFHVRYLPGGSQRAGEMRFDPREVAKQLERWGSDAA